MEAKYAMEIGIGSKTSSVRREGGEAGGRGM